MKILVTGAAGFIGYHVCKRLISLGHDIFGIDNINDYYSPKLKFDRLLDLGIAKEDACVINNNVTSLQNSNFIFSRTDIVDVKNLTEIFEQQKFDVVCNLAAQAGVRYSIENPMSYIESNVLGFSHILELCRGNGVKHLVYASSSSVYGDNEKVPFSIDDNVDFPVSLYAATKKSNELMAHSYNHLYGFSTTGMRFFSVYGPWGRPDMAYYLFSNAIVNKEAINVFNDGKMERDFTYIDDIVEGVNRIIDKGSGDVPRYKIYNMGYGKPVNLLKFIEYLEDSIGMKTEKVMHPMQMGDVKKTWADISDMKRDYNYQPKISIETGIKKYVQWYKNYTC